MKQSFVFEGNKRFPASHAGSICELPNGDLLAAWYAGSKESAPDSVCLGSRLPAGSDRWQPPDIWVDVPGHASGNPRVFVGPDDAVWLIAPVNYGHWCDGGTRMFFKRSYDLGKTWKDLEIFPARKRVLGKNKPIHIENPDIWIIPVEYEGLGDIAFMRSVNQGKTWKTIDCTGEGAYLDQPTVVQLANGDLLAYNRSWEGYIYETRSKDLGLTWSVPAPTRLLNPNSGIDMVRLRAGKIVLACNPVGLGPNGDLTVGHAGGERVPARQNLKELRKAGDYELSRMIGKQEADLVIHPGGYLAWGPRYPLCLVVSDDEGLTWKNKITLETEPGEYSYPAIIQSSDGAVHVVYTYKRNAMKYARIDESEL
jgi:predicted neuraminidase